MKIGSAANFEPALGGSGHTSLFFYTKGFVARRESPKPDGA